MLRIAIDGPSGAGKSTLAKALAKELGIVYVDTGALYRTVGYYVFMHDADPKNADAVASLLPDINIEIKYENGTQDVILNGESMGDKIRQPQISMYASAVSAIPAVREFLLFMQKDIASKNSVVMDGRDIGTVIMPDADVKLFLQASNECRARRRTEELRQRGVEANYEDVLADMRQRDENDKNRDIAPALAAPDAIIFDNSELTIDESVEEVKKIIEQKKKSQIKKKENRFYSFMYWLLAKIIRKLYRIRIIGAENEPAEPGFIVASNHSSGTDPVLIGAAMKNQICFMGKKELFGIPIVGSFLKSLGGYPIDRKGNDIGALKTTVALLKSGKSIGIFPQGTRHPGVNPRGTEVKSGVALIASRSGADIVPVCVKTKADKAKMFRKTYIIIGKTISNAALGLGSAKGSVGYRNIADSVFDKICDLYDSTDIENVSTK